MTANQWAYPTWKLAGVATRSCGPHLACPPIGNLVAWCTPSSFWLVLEARAMEKMDPVFWLVQFSGWVGFSGDRCCSGGIRFQYQTDNSRVWRNINWIEIMRFWFFFYFGFYLIKIDFGLILIFNYLKNNYFLIFYVNKKKLIVLKLIVLKLIILIRGEQSINLINLINFFKLI